MNNILAADIGGTNSRFAYFQADTNHNLSLGESKWLKTRHSESFHDLLNQLSSSDFTLPLDEADAGIVYVSDINGDVANNIGWINIPDEFNTIATYPIASVATSENQQTAQLFIDFVLSPQGQQILESFNFSPAVN